MTVAQLTASMSAAELTRWQALYLIEQDERRARESDHKARQAEAAARAKWRGARK